VIRRTGATLLPVAVLAVVPGAASAGPLVIADNTGGDTIEASVSDGQDHQVTVSASGGSTVLHDPAGIQSLQPSCLAVDPATVRCGRGTGRTSVEIRTGAGDDTVTFASLQGNGVGEAIAGPGNDRLVGSSNHGGNQLKGEAGNDRILGRDGNDALYGGGGNDRLKGGTGTDFFAGGGGADLILARDGERDSRILCGSGADQALLDAIDMAQSC
jgi:Ca2+-binding RTX toxin-like protein